MSALRVALCQVDPVVGDIDGNSRRIVSDISSAEERGVDVVAFPELAITGYPPEDLLLKPAFVAENLAAVESVARAARNCVALVGFVDVAGHAGVSEAVAAAAGAGRIARESAVRGAPRLLRNSLAVCTGGEVVGVYHKRLLPNYGVFDEDRWFAPGAERMVLYRIAGATVGVSVCEDLWFASGPIEFQARAGARLVVNINASPYSVGRSEQRIAIARERVAQTGCAIAYVNQVGGQDELVFDGGSFVMDERGELLAMAPLFEEATLVLDLEVDRTEGVAPQPHTGHGGLGLVELSSTPRSDVRIVPPPMPPTLSEEAEVYGALVLGTRDYMTKNGFTDAVIGLSGGIDSSLVAAVAADALGAAHVHGVSMPSRYSSTGSITDAAALAENLGIELCSVPIEQAHEAFSDLLSPALGEVPWGLCDENLQSRIRGVLLMAISNAKGWIVLTTGNKSELATGYSTLYGDSAGGFAVIKDVPKTMVYRLCRYRNELAGTEVVPESVLIKAPSAELRPDQRDEDSLPPYEILDPILDGLVARDKSIAEVAAEGFDLSTVIRVARLVDAAEYKRRQSPPGVRISAKAFGRDRRMPITNRYRDHVSPGSPPGHAPTTTQAAQGAQAAQAAHGAQSAQGAHGAHVVQGAHAAQPAQADQGPQVPPSAPSGRRGGGVPGAGTLSERPGEGAAVGG